MKKLSKLFSLVFVCFTLVLALTSCGQSSNDVDLYEVKSPLYVFNAEAFLAEENAKALVEWVGKGNKAEDFEPSTTVYLGLFDQKNSALYLEGALVPKGSYLPVVKGNGLPKLESDTKSIFGPYFAGWYQTAELRNHEKLNNRLITFNEFAKDEDHIVYAYSIDFLQAIIVAVVCILIVFAMLVLLWGLVMLLRFVAPSQKIEEKAAKPAQTHKPAPVKQAITLADIKDEDMMVAALVATVDYHEETKQDVRVVSIKEIK